MDGDSPATNDLPAESLDDIPLAALWPSEPTRADRLRATALFWITLFIGGAISFFVLYLLGPMALPAPRSVAIRSSPLTGAAIGGVFFGLVLAFTALPWRLVRRFPDRRDRLIFERMLRRRSSRERAEQSADSHGRFDVVAGIAGRLLVIAVGLYCWTAWTTMYLGVAGNKVSWRTFTLVRHHRSARDVAAIYLTKKYGGGSGRPDRPCVVVQFVDRTEIRSDELSPRGDECDRVAQALSEVSGKPIKSAPWLEYVPRPK